MCGICGIAFADPTVQIGPEAIGRMRDSIRLRGPDDAGSFVAPGIALGVRRLAILDLSERGHMPMTTADGRFTIVYNGEVFNFRELRSELEGRGCRFRSDSDCEVVLQLYALEGAEMLARLNGMFALAIWDAQERQLFVARDRLGIKPLYFTARNGDLLFASEAKALFAAGVEPQFDPDTLAEILCFRFVAGSRSPYRGVQRLLPGHYLLWKGGQAAVRRWWNLSERARERRAAIPGDAAEWYRETFDSSVAYRRISDVPVGVLLSGGLDSSSVAASLALQGNVGLASFTVSFEESGYDETAIARAVAARYGFEFHHLRVPPARVAELIREASFLNDEPLVHGNDVQLLAIARYAKPRVTVLLSGEGGDETLGGYVRYRPLRFPALLKAAALGPRPRSAGRVAKFRRMARLGRPQRWVLYNACDVLPEELESTLGVAAPDAGFVYRTEVLEEARQLHPGDLARQAMYADQHTFLCSVLDRNDRMTMGASIECRVPFLDYRLVEGLAALPSRPLLRGTKGKPLLRRALGPRLPAEVLAHRKWGFGVPWAKYLREAPEFRDWVATLPERDPVRTGLLPARKVRTVLDRFFAGDRSLDALVRQIFMLTVWYESVWGSAVAARRVVEGVR